MNKARFRLFCRKLPENAVQLLLELRENVRDTINLIDPELAARIDFTRLEQIKTTFIPKEMRKLEADLLYTVPMKTTQSGEEREVLVYILIEHQSSPERLMMFRLLSYMLAIWNSQLRKSESEDSDSFQFRSIMPIVFYTGTTSWKRLKPMSELVELGDEFPDWVPTCRPLLLSVHDTSAEQLAEGGGWFGQVLKFVQSRDADIESAKAVLAEVITALESMPRSEQRRWREFLYYLHCLVYHYRSEPEVRKMQQAIEDSVTDSNHQTEARTMGQSYAQYLQEIAEKRGEKRGERRGEKRGEKRGILKTQRDNLLFIIRDRFGDVPAAIENAIARTNDLQLLQDSFQRATKISSLDELKLDVG